MQAGRTPGPALNRPMYASAIGQSPAPARARCSCRGTGGCRATAARSHPARSLLYTLGTRALSLEGKQVHERYADTGRSPGTLSTNPVSIPTCSSVTGTVGRA